MIGLCLNQTCKGYSLLNEIVHQLVLFSDHVVSPFSADDGVMFQEKKSSLSYKLRKEMKKERKEKRREEKEKQRQAEGKDKFREKDKNGGPTVSELVGSDNHCCTARCAGWLV